MKMLFIDDCLTFSWSMQQREVLCLRAVFKQLARKLVEYVIWVCFT